MAQKIKEKLVVAPEVRKMLIAEFGCQTTVYNALAFRTEAGQSEAIRTRAKELGARVQRTYY